LDLRYDAEVIKFRLRTEAKISLKDLAKIIGCDPSTVSMIVSGRRTSASITTAILDLLGEDDPATLWPTKYSLCKKSRRNS